MVNPITVGTMLRPYRMRNPDIDVAGVLLGPAPALRALAIDFEDSTVHILSI
jgi:hypothetical protein